MHKTPEGLVFRPPGTRVRPTNPGPPNALDTRREPFDPLELYFSALRADYLAGRIKQVANTYRADNRVIHASYSIVAAPAGEHAARASRHREQLLTELRFQYKNAVVRNVASNIKNAKRMRARVNAALGTNAPTPIEVDQMFEDHPGALAAAAEIRALIVELEE